MKAQDKLLLMKLNRTERKRKKKSEKVSRDRLK